jgi:hypothetical protein
MMECLLWEALGERTQSRNAGHRLVRPCLSVCVQMRVSSGWEEGVSFYLLSSAFIHKREISLSEACTPFGLVQ